MVRPVAQRMPLTSRPDGTGGFNIFWFICMSSVNTISQKSSVPQLPEFVS
jgi:hypothetical protein